MALTGSLRLPLELGIRRNHGHRKRFQNLRTPEKLCLLRISMPSISLKQYCWSSKFSKRIHRQLFNISCRKHQFKCHCLLNPGQPLNVNCVKNATLTSSFNLHGSPGPVVIKLASSVGIFIFAIWGIGPLVRLTRNMLMKNSESSWKKSSAYQVTTLYIQPLLLWAGANFICRTLGTRMVAGQIVDQRLITFISSLSTVLTFAYCFSSLVQQAQKSFMEANAPNDTRNMSLQFAGRAVNWAVWVAAISLFMELLGYKTNKLVTAGGFGTVLLTLAGREIFTNFLSSVIIHATRPFVVNERIQTKVQGYEVSGRVEHVGWWSPTIIRGEDREAIHVPNHKLTKNVVRNLSHKTHFRIKTHLAVSHLDISKINSIVADMRKVLAKNPQIEQQKLHRRVFLENIDPENQALMILVSCFVKTSRSEEYRCVKEAILLDLLRVIGHHGARLATPICTVQKIFTDADLDEDTFSEPMYNRRPVVNRPLLLTEPSHKSNGEDKKRNKARPARPTAQDKKAPGKSTTDVKVAQEKKASTKSTTDSKLDAKEQQDGRRQVSQPPTTKGSLEDNIVLGVALEGRRRRLPIEEDVEPLINTDGVGTGMK